MKLFNITDKTLCIDTGMTYIPFFKLNDRDIVLLDSGWGEGEREGIDALISKESYTVRAIINSHAHIDHAGSNMHFKEKHGAMIYMSELEAALCQSPMSVKAYFGGFSLDDVYDHFKDLISVTDYTIKPSETHISIDDNIFTIVHTPGHSPGHIAIITPDNVAYVGDALISYEVMKGAKMPYAFLLSEDLKSKEKLKALNCEAYVVAHKGLYKQIEKLIDDNVDFYKYRAERVKEVLIHPMTHEQVLNAVIREFNIRIRSIHGQQIIERMMRSFLDYLIEINQVCVFLEGGFIKYAKKETLVAS